MLISKLIVAASTTFNHLEISEYWRPDINSQASEMLRSQIFLEMLLDLDVFAEDAASSLIPFICVNDRETSEKVRRLLMQGIDRSRVETIPFCFHVVFKYLLINDGFTDERQKIALQEMFTTIQQNLKYEPETKASIAAIHKWFESSESLNLLPTFNRLTYYMILPTINCWNSLIIHDAKSIRSETKEVLLALIDDKFRSTPLQYSSDSGSADDEADDDLLDCPRYRTALRLLCKTSFSTVTPIAPTAVRNNTNDSSCFRYVELLSLFRMLLRTADDCSLLLNSSKRLFTLYSSINSLERENDANKLEFLKLIDRMLTLSDVTLDRLVRDRDTNYKNAEILCNTWINTTDSTNQFHVEYNESMLPLLYGILLKCCQASREFTMMLTSNQTFEWGLTNLFVSRNYYPKLSIALLQLVKFLASCDFLNDWRLRLLKMYWATPASSNSRSTLTISQSPTNQIELLKLLLTTKDEKYFALCSNLPKTLANFVLHIQNKSLNNMTIYSGIIAVIYKLFDYLLQNGTEYCLDSIAMNRPLTLETICSMSYSMVFSAQHVHRALLQELQNAILHENVLPVAVRVMMVKYVISGLPEVTRRLNDIGLNVSESPSTRNACTTIIAALTSLSILIMCDNEMIVPLNEGILSVLSKFDEHSNLWNHAQNFIKRIEDLDESNVVDIKPVHTTLANQDEIFYSLSISRFLMNLCTHFLTNEVELQKITAILPSVLRIILTLSLSSSWSTSTIMHSTFVCEIQNHLFDLTVQISKVQVLQPFLSRDMSTGILLHLFLADVLVEYAPQLYEIFNSCHLIESETLSISYIQHAFNLHYTRITDWMQLLQRFQQSSFTDPLLQEQLFSTELRIWISSAYSILFIVKWQRYDQSTPEAANSGTSIAHARPYILIRSSDVLKQHFQEWSSLLEVFILKISTPSSSFLNITMHNISQLKDLFTIFSCIAAL